MTKHNLSLEDRFMSHVQKPKNLNGCWTWIGSKIGNGYGLFGINHKLYLAHRISYALFVGMIPDGMEVCHSCDNPSCVNYSHLFLGTRQDNVNDKVSKNRQHHPNQKGEHNNHHKLTEQEIYKIREMIVQDYTNKEIANIFGVNRTTISLIKSGALWGWLK